MSQRKLLWEGAAAVSQVRRCRVAGLIPPCTLIDALFKKTSDGGVVLPQLSFGEVARWQIALARTPIQFAISAGLFVKKTYPPGS